MSGSAPDGSSPSPKWLSGQGAAPELGWHCGMDGPLVSLSYARESGDLFAADETGTLYRIGRDGQIAALTRFQEPVAALAWSDDGSSGAVISGENRVLRLDRNLQLTHKFELPDVCMSVAVTPFGHQLCVALASGKNVIYNDRNRRIASFETMRPLSFLRFCATEPLVFGAAEHGMICCFNLSGAEVWREKNWSNVGQLCITGDGEIVYLASFAHGVQAFDGDGDSLGSYVLDGTVHRVAATFEPQRLIAATIERGLFWLDADGEMLWASRVSDDIIDVVCDPLGQWTVCGLAEQGLYQLIWPTA